MKSIRFILALLVSYSSPVVHAGMIAAPKKWVHVFEKTVVFGSSISANTMRTMGLPTAPLTGAALYGVSPAHLLAKQCSNQSILKNFAAPFGSPTGAEQIATMLREEQQILQEATAIIGIDAFYWDAVWGVREAEQQALQLINFAQANRKVLILGTVPIEVPENVTWTRIPQWVQDLLASYNRVAWAPPQVERAKSINSLLHKACLSNHNCYLVDIATTVDLLNRGESVQLANGKKYSLYGIRPDGVHISSAGSQYICEQILKKFENQPPVF